MSPPETPPVPPGATAPPPAPKESGAEPPVPPSPPSGATPGGEGGSNRGLMIVLAYLGPLALIPVFATEDEDLRWHGRQGLVLMGAEIVVWLAGAVLFGLVAMFDFGCVGCVFHMLFVLFVLVLHIACIVQGLNGKRLRVPGVADLADRFGA